MLPEEQETLELGSSLKALLADCDIIVEIHPVRAHRPNKKTDFSVYLGPYQIARGTSRTKALALDAVADVVVKTRAWLESP